MARINVNEFSAQAGGLAYRANQVRTDPAVVKAAKDAWADVKDARHSCTVLAREANAAWQRTRTTDAHQTDLNPPLTQDRTDVGPASTENTSTSGY
jgi:hypothetical protein